MKNFLFLLCLIPSLALAQDKKIYVTPATTYLNTVSCISTAPAASRTAYIPVGTLGPDGRALQLAILNIYLDYTASATVIMTCTASPDGGITDYIIQDCAMAAGTCTSSDLTWSKASGSADKKWAWRIDTTGFVEMECVFLCSGSDVDTIKVVGYQTTR